MSFINQEAASAIQYLTFPLEATGFGLAYVEIRHPALAARIAKIQLLSTKLFESDLEKLDIDSARRKRNETYGTLCLFVLMFLGLIVLAGAWAAGSISGVLPFSGTIVEPLLVLTMILFSTAMLFGASTKWVKGREVGTFGLILASMSLLGETYQFIAQLIL